MSDEDGEHLRANINEKKEITEFVENSSHKNLEGEKKKYKRRREWKK